MKAFLAQVTLTRRRCWLLLRLVGKQVLVEIIHLGEAFFAHVTLVGFVANMNFDVLVECVVAREVFATHSTVVRLLPCVG